MEGSGVALTSLPRTDVFNPSPTSHWRLVELRCSLLDQSACSSWICRSAQLRYICTYFAPVRVRVVWYLFVPSLWFSVLMNRRSTPTQETFSPHKCCLHHSRWVERRAWRVCVCVCVCVFVCVWRHQQGGVEVTRSLDDSIFGTILRGSSVHFEPAMQLPISSRCRFCRGFASVSIEAQQLLCSVGLHLSAPPFNHTPWGLSSWQLDRTTIMATSGYGVPCGLPGMPWRPFLRPRCPAATRGRYSPLTDGSTHAKNDNKTIQCTLEADTAHSQMGPLMPRVATRPYNAHLRQIQPTHRWIHSCQEWQQDHTMHTRGRYSPLSNGSTHAKSDNKTVRCTLEADTAHSQMGPLMPRVTTRPYNAHSRQTQPTLKWVHSCREWQQDQTMQTRGRYSPLTDGSTHVESNNNNI